MGKRYLIDTNTIIDFLGNKLSSTVIDWLEQIIDNQEHCLSVINKIELLSFNGDPAEMAITTENGFGILQNYNKPEWA